MRLNAAAVLLELPGLEKGGAGIHELITTNIVVFFVYVKLSLFCIMPSWY